MSHYGGEPEVYPELAAPSAEYDAPGQVQITTNNQVNETERALNDTNDPDKIADGDDDKLPDISPKKANKIIDDDDNN